MKLWKARLMTFLTLMALILAAFPGTALADNECREEGLDLNREDCDEFLDDFEADFVGEDITLLIPLVIEVDLDVDCDGEDDDLDGLADEDAECVVEVDDVDVDVADSFGEAGVFFDF